MTVQCTVQYRELNLHFYNIKNLLNYYFQCFQYDALFNTKKKQITTTIALPPNR